MLKNICISGITAAIVAFGVVACSDGGTDPTTIVCSADGDCRVGEICHPTGKVCVQTCTAGEDCPDASKNCAEISATDTQKICKCTTSVLCQGGVAGADSICSETFDVCAPKCATNTDCPAGYDCDSATGDCNPSAGGDGGTDAGMAASCDWSTPNSACIGGTVCNLKVGQCLASVSCMGEGNAGGTCSYGSACVSGACDPVDRPSGVAGSCTPYSFNNITWNPASDTGPVIYSVENVPDVPADCTMGTAQTVRVKAYGTTNFPADKSQLNGFNYVNQSGNKVSIPPFLKASKYTGGGTQSITAEFTLCNMQTAGGFSAGFEFAGGNQFCFLVQ